VPAVLASVPALPLPAPPLTVAALDPAALVVVVLPLRPAFMPLLVDGAVVPALAVA
jgi:hypothetical protein